MQAKQVHQSNEMMRAYYRNNILKLNKSDTYFANSVKCARHTGADNELREGVKASLMLECYAGWL